MRCPTRRERRALLVYVGFVMALSYRPGHPLDGLAGGVVAVVLLARMIWTLSQLRDAERRDRQ
jgi:hypothetical protein